MMHSGLVRTRLESIRKWMWGAEDWGMRRSPVFAYFAKEFSLARAANPFLEANRT